MISKRFIRIEIAIVLLLSLGTSAIYSLLRFAEALLSRKGLGGTRTELNPSQARAEFFDFSYQLLGLLFAVAPAILVLYLLRRDSEKAFDEIGIWPISHRQDLLRGLALAAVIGLPGLALYATARLLGLASQVVPAD
ncbi:MAG: hypothetical protein RIR24_650, partial [Actinomycetota bacterium]